MSIVLLFLVTFSLVASILLVISAGLLISRDRRQLNMLAARLLAEQQMEAATRATLRAMRDAVREPRG